MRKGRQLRDQLVTFFSPLRRAVTPPTPCLSLSLDDIVQGHQTTIVSRADPSEVQDGGLRGGITGPYLMIKALIGK